jgi:chromate reductase
MAEGLTILGLSGSLRAKSYNSAALRAAAGLAPAGVRVIEADISDLPLFNDDVRLSGYPPPAERLRRQVRDADGILLVSPEYNYSVPGVLKNAIDWVSRPPDPPFSGKPAGIMGASNGIYGTARGQHHLRQVCHGVNLQVMTRPEVMIPKAGDKFDADGKLIDAHTHEVIVKFMAALAEWIRRIRA